MGPHLLVWYICVAIMVTAYLVVGGTRLGFGIGFLFATPQERPYLVQALSPHVDGSGMWLLLTVTSLLALFPRVFRVLFTGFYPVIAVVLIVLGLRILAFGLRGRLYSKYTGPFLDVFISVGNILLLFLIGLMAGYILKGVPLYGEGRFNVNVLGYLNHYTIASGLLTVFSCAALSFLAIAWNSDGRIQAYARIWSFYSAMVVCVLIFDLGLWSFVLSPYIAKSLNAAPVMYLVPGVAFIGALILPVLIWKRHYKAAYIIAAVIMICLIVTFFLTIFPHLRQIFISNNPLAPGVGQPVGGNRAIVSTARANLFKSRKTLLPVYLFIMVANAFIQYRMFRLYHKFTHCPLPYDDEYEDLF